MQALRLRLIANAESKKHLAELRLILERLLTEFTEPDIHTTRSMGQLGLEADLR